MSVVRREAAAEQVRRWGGDRVVIDDDKLESNLAQSLSDTELDIVVDPVGGRACCPSLSMTTMASSKLTMPFGSLVGRVTWCWAA
jgi:NADPH:quinone reductase-like Zn-dependent oxidoreductase